MSQPVKWIEASSEEPVVDVATRSLEIRLESVQKYLPLAAKKADKNIEQVHLLRVSARRAQAALSLYGELMPTWRVAWMEQQMRHIRRATNDARDDDVFAIRLAKDKKRKGSFQLLKRVKKHRKKSQKPIVAIFRKLRRNDRLKRGSEKLLKRIRLRGNYKNSTKKLEFEDWASQHFAPVLDHFLQLSDFDNSDLEAFHQFRIAGKSVRYAMELLAGAFEPAFRCEVYPEFEKLQDKLSTLR